MKPPIIGYSEGNPQFFKTAESAASYMEPADVRNGEWVLYDSEGRQLRAEVAKGFLSEFVVLHPAESKPTHQRELIQILIDYLCRRGELEDDVREQPLSELLELARRYAGET